MAFKDVILKIQRSFLCCSKRERKCPLDIGSPTNVRRVDVSGTLPGLTDAERKYIREKVSSDAIHLLGLQSHPPSHSTSQPTTTPPSPEHSLRHEPNSTMSSREPSMALLNTASKDLPDALPTPPRQTHPPTSPPSARMKRMWAGVKRLSNSSSCRDSLYSKIGDGEKANDLSMMTLNLDFDSESPGNRKHADSPRTLSLASGFETQNTVGGHSDVSLPLTKNGKVDAAVKETEVVDSSEDEDPFIAAEGKMLKKF
ncbi:uncharacterized protein M421DRAFT_162889 [Didymella exigua CBS 183.55]|uniref:Uncharacterized protein n=1 Tax=Didymella exigua CBS 183.55 TaxID=1150837 RepID=A0A6A5RLB8_9PLEO|nr:uncharacterized protein M421DRAFT_162889 [Didymella exigua CBS 183.55]KAF1927898.1 hypothetical protein M421DRAFT_162889 [Didymella exigua CBS 183.55]